MTPNCFTNGSSDHRSNIRMDARDNETQHLKVRVKHLEEQLKDALQTIEILLKENEKLRSRVAELKQEPKTKKNDKKGES